MMTFTGTPMSGTSRHLCVASVLASFAKPGKQGSRIRTEGLSAEYEAVSADSGRNQVVYRARIARSARREAHEDSLPQFLVLGDDCEIEGAREGEPTGNGTVLQCRPEEGRLSAVTSIPGLPALYVAQTPSAFVITSDLFLLRQVEDLVLRFDPEGIADLAWMGRPVGHRTLFAGVRMLPGGQRLTFDHRTGPRFEAAWTAPPRSPCTTWDEYTALQSDAFQESVACLDVSDCRLSLSSGLDSRTTFAGLISRNNLVAALTVSGENSCLDARTAAKLCAAYGVEHLTVKLDDEFRRSLPDLTVEASLLSGGIGSVWNVAQVYCYCVLGSPPPVHALSGYLGNQIGRRGTEGLTPRGATGALLSTSLAVPSWEGRPEWYADAMQPDGFLESRFLIQEESTFGNLASYAIGNSYSIQQSAYAYRPLIENMWRMPTIEAQDGKGSHVQNLKHLFLGEPLEESFQRRYINRVGGLVASYPVNWGWRSKGGVSPRGVLWGGLALADAIISSRFSDTPVFTLARRLGIAGLHEFRPVHEWLHRHMRDFVYDELLSTTAADSGLFDVPRLAPFLDGYYSGGARGFREIVLALDLALAARNFGATA